MATEQAAVCHGERGEGDGSRRQAEGRSSHSCTLTGNEWRSGEWVGPGCREQAEDSSQIGHLLLGHHPGCRAPSPSTPPSPFWWFPGGGGGCQGHRNMPGSGDQVLGLGQRLHHSWWPGACQPLTALRARLLDLPLHPVCPAEVSSASAICDEGTETPGLGLPGRREAGRVI